MSGDRIKEIREMFIKIAEGKLYAADISWESIASDLLSEIDRLRLEVAKLEAKVETRDEEVARLKEELSLLREVESEAITAQNTACFTQELADSLAALEKWRGK